MSGSRSDVVSSFTVIKGSLIEETYHIFQNWDCDRSKEHNLGRVREQNPIGATSENWLRDVNFVISRRFDPNGRDRNLVAMAQARVPLSFWKPALLWHMTRDEFLVRDFLVNWLYAEYEDGAFRLRTTDLHGYLVALHGRGLTDAPWKKTTLERVASALLRMAVDFDLMTGTTAREFNSYHLPEESFLYLLHALYEQHGNGHDVIHSEDWRMYLMSADDVERDVYRLHQFRKLRFEKAGTLVELTLPYQSSSDFAGAMTQ
ncbi:MAG: DUF1819 family protein [Rhodothermales bacterium]|nr:DUF1819 family protein [Rhodothermales bacterium]MBO6778673.1 DUF1819 family protein [Rhodothermales bacterium]